ncbi:class I SAM-dependent methyltransferase [Alphaproteobacteria bacterium]|nr:class I SAM-dependent methyltransferase [Alphaproteobacteria bacterium]
MRGNIVLKEQYIYWNKYVHYWLKYDDAINKKFENITEILISSLDLSKANNILDVGCGSGCTTKIISDKLNSAGKVLGMDLSLPMLKLLKKKYKQIKNIKTIQSDAQSYNFKKGSFEIVLSRFGLMFFENPYSAFINIYKSLKKKGVLSFVCWTDFKYNDFFSIPTEVLKSVTGLKKKKINKKPGPFAFNNKKYIYDILLKSNFSKVSIKTIKTRMIADNINTDIDIFMNIGIAAKIMKDNNLSPEIKIKIKAKLNNYLKKNIYLNAGFYRAKFFLVYAQK